MLKRASLAVGLVLLVTGSAFAQARKPSLVWGVYRDTAIVFAQLPFTPPPEWHAIAVADFDRDGMPDIVWKNSITHQVTIWFLQAPRDARLAYQFTILSSQFLTVPPAAQLAPLAPGHWWEPLVFDGPLSLVPYIMWSDRAPSDVP